MQYKKKTKTFWNKNYTYILLKIFVLIVIFYCISIYKPLIIVIVFEALDFLKNILKQIIPELPIDFAFVFGITASYYYSPYVAFIIFFLGVLNRVIMLNIERRHFIKTFRHFLFFLLVPFFRGFNFILVSITCISLNYILKYVFKFSTHNVELNKIPFHFINYFGSIFLFYMIYTIYSYFPFLA
jgi:hypothetical protein